MNANILKRRVAPHGWHWFDGATQVASLQAEGGNQWTFAHQGGEDTLTGMDKDKALDHAETAIRSEGVRIEVPGTVDDHADLMNDGAGPEVSDSAAAMAAAMAALALNPLEVNAVANEDGILVLDCEGGRWHVGHVRGVDHEEWDGTPPRKAASDEADDIGTLSLDAAGNLTRNAAPETGDEPKEDAKHRLTSHVLTEQEGGAILGIDYSEEDEGGSVLARIFFHKDRKVDGWVGETLARYLPPDFDWSHDEVADNFVEVMRSSGVEVVRGDDIVIDDLTTITDPVQLAGTEARREWTLVRTARFITDRGDFSGVDRLDWTMKGKEVHATVSAYYKMREGIWSVGYDSTVEDLFRGKGPYGSSAEADAAITDILVDAGITVEGDALEDLVKAAADDKPAEEDPAPAASGTEGANEDPKVLVCREAKDGLEVKWHRPGKGKGSKPGECLASVRKKEAGPWKVWRHKDMDEAPLAGAFTGDKDVLSVIATMEQGFEADGWTLTE